MGLCLWRLSFCFFWQGCAVGCIVIFADFFLLGFFGIGCFYAFIFKLDAGIKSKALASKWAKEAPPPAPFAAWVRAGMACPDLKWSEAERRGASHVARNTTWLFFFTAALRSNCTKDKKITPSYCARAGSKQPVAQEEVGFFLCQLACKSVGKKAVTTDTIDRRFLFFFQI